MEAEIREREKKLLDENEKELKTSDDYEKFIFLLSVFNDVLDFY